MCYTCCVQSCRIGGAGGVPPPPWRPSAWARPFPPEVAPTSVQIRVRGDRFRAGPTPANADAIQPKSNPSANVVVRATATPEPTRTVCTARTIRARPPTRSAVSPHTRAGRGRPRAVGLAQPRHPAGSGGSLRTYGFGLGGCGRGGAGGGFGGVGRGVGGATTARADATRMVNVSCRITRGC